MTSPIQYLVVSSAFLAISYLVYIIVFRKERNFKQRRLFLLVTLFLSLLLPFSNIYDAESKDIMKLSPKKKIDWWRLISYIYLTISVFLLSRITVQVLVLQLRSWKSDTIDKPGYKLIINEYYQSSFSFFNRIFIHVEKKDDPGLEEIISHECIHIRQKHSLDSMLFEIVCSLMWFNPFIWMMRNSLQLVHEYLADEGALDTGIDIFHYQTLMINQVAETNIISFTSRFNHSTLKKRLRMIMNREKHRKTKFRILTILPVAIFFFLAIATVNGCSPRKVMEKKLSENQVIKSTFSRNEILDLAELRLLFDRIIVNQTKEKNVNDAYRKYMQYLGENENAGQISTKIVLPFDSLAQVMVNNNTYKNIWTADSINNGITYFHLNTHSKIMIFISNLAKENPNYETVLKGIEIAGDISPATITNLLKYSNRSNWDSEAEKLYAAIILPILGNKMIPSIALNNRAVELMNTGNLDSSLVLLNQSIRKDSTYQVAHANKAAIFIHQAKFEKALDEFKEALKESPNESEYWKMLGILNDILGNEKESTLCYEKCIYLYNKKLESNDKQIIYKTQLNKAMVLILNKQEEQGKELFAQIKKEYPDNMILDTLSKRTKEDFLNDFYTIRAKQN